MPTPGHVAWTGCGGGFQCGTVQVPLDYANPAGDKIGIAVTRKPATDSTARIGSLLINPGGPGASGITWVKESAPALGALNRRFDLVGFDPRGVGLSSPVHCLDGPQRDVYNALDPVWDDPQEKQRGLQADQNYASACEQRSGGILPYVDTENAARDMDEIRMAVGDQRLTYLGFSYGTFLGEMYAHIFPSHIRALSLDAVVDPSISATDFDIAQLKGFEANLQAFLTDCRSRRTGSNPCRFAASGDPGQKLIDLMNRLDVTPLKVGSRLLTRAIGLNGVIQALYDQSYWSDLDLSLVAADQGNGAGLMAFSDMYFERNPDGTYANTEDANSAINCLDHPVPPNISDYDALAAEYQQASPTFGQAFQYDWVGCTFWPVKPTRTPGPLDAPGAPPILLVGGTNDPATPYAWAQAVHSQIANSVLLTREGNGHGSYGASVCADDAENAYLINLTLPADGTICSN